MKVCLPCFPVIAAIPDRPISWTEISLFVGAVALAAFAVLVQFGIIAPISSNWIAYSLYTGSFLFLLIEIAIQTCKCQREKQIGKFKQELTEQPLTQEEILARLPLYNFHLNDFGAYWGVLCAQKKGTPLTSTVLKRDVTIGNQNGTLFGLYKKEGDENLLVERLEATEHKDVKVTLDLLGQFCDETNACVAIQLNGILYVGGDKFLYTEGNLIKKASQEMFHLIPQDEQKQLVIFLSQEAYPVLEKEGYAPLMDVHTIPTSLLPEHLTKKFIQFFSAKKIDDISAVILIV